jgi:hypothetical protein
MSCHIRYFRNDGIFESVPYITNMGIDLITMTAGSQNLSTEDKRVLRQAILVSDADSQKGKTQGIVNLIQLVEQLQDKYKITHENTHPTNDILKDMCAEPVLIKKYHLDDLFDIRLPDMPLGQKFNG